MKLPNFLGVEMNHEVEKYVGELRELRNTVTLLTSKNEILKNEIDDLQYEMDNYSCECGLCSPDEDLVSLIRTWKPEINQLLEDLIKAENSIVGPEIKLVGLLYDQWQDLKELLLKLVKAV